MIIPARDAQSTLGRTLECLSAQRADFDFETIVVDDGSRDATAAVAREAPGDVRVVSQAGAGPAAARNRGVAESRGEALAFCDADCYPEPGWLEAGVRALEGSAMVQGRVLPEPGVAVGPYDRTLWIEGEVGLWETANLFVRRDAFDRVGGFEDWLRPVAGKAMAEDVWFGWRVKRLGETSAFCPEALAHHAVFPRGAREYVAERRRLRHFPEMVAKMPELRAAFLHRRLFLNERTAALDCALVGALAAARLRRPWPLLLGLAYARRVRSRARGHAVPAAEVAAADVAGDLVGALALARGSVAARTPVL